jgi:hypothetical protein
MKRPPPPAGGGGRNDSSAMLNFHPGQVGRRQPGRDGLRPDASP